MKSRDEGCQQMRELSRAWLHYSCGPRMTSPSTPRITLLPKWLFFNIISTPPNASVPRGKHGMRIGGGKACACLASRCPMSEGKRRYLFMQDMRMPRQKVGFSGPKRPRDPLFCSPKRAISLTSVVKKWLPAILHGYAAYCLPVVTLPCKMQQVAVGIFAV